MRSQPNGELQLADTATWGGTTSERAQAMLTGLRRIVPYDGAWLALADPLGHSYSSLASVGLDAPIVDFLSGPLMARDIEITGTDQAIPPVSPSDLPYPAEELRTWAECLMPTGIYEALAHALLAPGGRHVGFVVLSGSRQPPTAAARRRLAAQASVLAHGIDPMRSLLTITRLIRGATAGTVLRKDGLTEPLPGLDAGPLLAVGSPVLTAACGRITDGQAYSSFLWPVGGSHAPDGHARITALAAPDDVPAVLSGVVTVSPPPDLHGLTPRELEVLGLVVEGYSNQEIARTLVVAPRTVAAHLEHVLVKLDAPTRTLAAVRAEREGLYVPAVPRSAGQQIEGMPPWAELLFPLLRVACRRRVTDARGAPIQQVPDGARGETEAMRAMTYRGPYKVRVEEKERPAIEHPNDAIVRVTLAAICGSDLHLYHGLMPDTRIGHTFGHEFIGVVDEIGSSVQNLQVGDRVMVPFNIFCGSCWYCARGLYSNCHNVNPNATAVGGIYGYSHTTGGYDGGQSQFVRVPFADVGPAKIPVWMSDEDAVLLTDAVPTGYFGAQLGDIVEGDVVVVFGAGPVGLVAARSAWLMGAGRVIVIDHLEYRLEKARTWAHAETYNFTEYADIVLEMKKQTDFLGADVAIDAVGAEADGNFLQHVTTAKLKLQGGSPVALNWAIDSVRKGATISVVGAYGPLFSAVKFGDAMNKGLTLRMNQCPVKRQWPRLFEHVRNGHITPSELVTHRVPLDDIAEGYHIFSAKLDDCIKPLVIPSAA